MSASTSSSNSPSTRWQRRALAWLNARLADGRELDLPLGIMFHSDDYERSLYWIVGGDLAAHAYYMRELNDALHQWGLKALFALDHAAECHGCDGTLAHLVGADNVHILDLTARDLLFRIREVLLEYTSNTGAGIRQGASRDYAYVVGNQVSYSLLSDHTKR